MKGLRGLRFRFPCSPLAAKASTAGPSRVTISQVLKSPVLSTDARNMAPVTLPVAAVYRLNFEGPPTFIRLVRPTS